MNNNNITGIESMDKRNECNGKLLLQVGNPSSTEGTQEASDDNLFTEDVLEQLRNMNLKYGVLHAKKKFKMLNDRVTPTFTFKIIRLMEDHLTREMEACFMHKYAFIDHHSNIRVLVRKKGKMVRVPIAEVWLDWPGKRVFSLYG